jgi:hypothetical protein
MWRLGPDLLLTLAIRSHSQYHHKVLFFAAHLMSRFGSLFRGVFCRLVERSPFQLLEPAPLVSPVITHDRVLDKLGEGGVGIVHKARQMMRDRFVPLKLLPPHAASSGEDKARFLQEAKAAALLRRDPAGERLRGNPRFQRVIIGKDVL